jgi:putative ABC transport system permease protein
MNLALAATLARGGFSANRWRLALTVACIALGVALAVAVHTVHTSALAEVESAAHVLAGSADLEIRGPRSGFDDALFIAVALRPEVLAASPVVEVDAAIAGHDETLRVLGIDPFRALRLQPAFVAEGGANVADAAAVLDARSAWLSPGAATRFKLGKGDALRTHVASTTVDWSIAGVLPGLAEAGEIAVVDIAAAQERLGRLGKLSRIDVRLRPGVDRNAAAKALGAMLPPGVVVAAPASIAARAESITRAYRVNLDALSFIALATGAFLVFSTLALQAARRRQEFALLRALGVTRRGTFFLLAFEGATIGTLGAVIGLGLGLLTSRLVLGRVGTDLGAGFFSGGTGVFAPDAVALAFIALAGIGTAVAGALWVARGAARLDVAEALRDRAIDLDLGGQHDGQVAIVLALAGVPLLFAPPVGGLPIAGYAAIGAWLGAAVLSVGPLCRALLARWPEPADAVAGVARAQVRHLPGHLAASVAGIVMSASLCVAMAIMVLSFRVSLEDWLRGVVGADLYVRSGAGGDTGFFDAGDEARLAALAEVASLEPLRYDRLAMAADGPPLSLIARPVTPRILEGFRTMPAASPAPPDAIKVWISEAARDLYRWNAGDRVTLPIAGRAVPVQVAGVIRDYARTWGAVLIDIADYRRLTGDRRVNDFAIHLARGVDAKRGEEAIARALPGAHGLQVEDAANIRRRSLQIFDRSFAVTYALEAVAILIGLAGVTSSFAALAWSRRREFGVLRFLGFRRADVLRMLALEGAATGALGAAIGLAAGCAISLVLIHVVNRQSFHWTLEVHWPVTVLVSLTAAIVVLCAVGARASAAVAVRDEAVLAVKDDA